MMRPGPTISSVRQPRAWLIVAGGLALYGALVLVLLAAGIWPSLPLSWWVAQAAPPILYGLLVLVCVPRVSGSRWIVATLSLWAAHVLLGVLTGAVVARYGEATVDPAVAGAFPPPPLPQILWVPLLLIPLRDVIAGGSRLRRRRQASGRERGSRPGGRAPAPASPLQTGARAAGHAVATTGPAGAPSSERVMTEERLMADPGTRPRESHETGARQSPLGHVGPPGGRATPKEQTSDAVGARAVAEPAPAQRLLDEMLARDTSGDVVRVSFERVAGQLPAGAFHLPLERVAASLPEPGYLLIPRRLVLAQLAEGLVRAGWEVVGEQFPRRLLAMTDEEITREIPDGQLVLPLDELVPQLPPEIFVPAGPVADLEGIESFPSPFQAVPAGESAEVLMDTLTVDTPPEAEAETLTAPPAPTAQSSLEEEAEAGLERSEIPVLEDIEADPTLTGMVEVEPAAMATFETEAVAEPVAVPVATESRDEISALRRVAALLAPLMALDVGAESIDGVRLFTASSPGLSRNPAAARPLLPLMAEGRAPWPVNQMTLRGPDAALVLTPLGPMAEGGPVLVCAVQPGGALALLEILSLRAADGYARVSQGSHQASGDERPEPDLLDAEPPTRLRQIAATLDAIGPVMAATLRDPEAERDLYLFLPSGSDVRMVGSFASDLDGAMRKAAGSGPVFHTAVLRAGRRRLIVRLEDAARERSNIIVAGGETERPGLAYRQVESAALALGAR